MSNCKKNTGILILLAGWFIASCTALPAPETPADSNKVDGIILRASLAEGVTKTTLSFEDDVYKILWQTGDRVSINGNLSEAVAASDNGKKAVDFTVNGSLSAPYKVLYPGTNSANEIALPAKQNYVVNSFDPSAAASFGNARKSGNDYVASLTHFCGVIRFALKGSATLDRIELNALGGEKLYGNFTLATNSEGFTGSFSGGTAGTLTYSFGQSGLELSGTDTPIYIAIPAQAYSAGIEALVYQEDGAFMRLKFWGGGSTLGADDIVVFESKTYAAGRTENILAINTLTAEAGGDPTAAAAGITVATYNVLRLGEEDNRLQEAMGSDVAAMKTALGTAIKNTRADIIGFQEIGDKMYSTSRPYSLETIATNAGVSGYTWKLNNPSSSGGSYHYSNGFAYNNSVLTLSSSGRCWLNTNGGYSTSSSSGSSSPDRLIVWAYFTHKASGKKFYFFVTQLPTNEQSNYNLAEAGAVNAFAASKAGSTPVILAGDMNSADHADNVNRAGAQKLKEYWTDAYEYLDANGGLLDFYRTYSGTQSGSGESYYYDILRFCKNHPERRLDHIMVHGACTVQSYRTVRNVYTYNDDPWAPSDHLPVVSYITLD